MWIIILSMVLIAKMNQDLTQRTNRCNPGIAIIIIIITITMT